MLTCEHSRSNKSSNKNTIINRQSQVINILKRNSKNFCWKMSNLEEDEIEPCEDSNPPQLKRKNKYILSIYLLLWHSHRLCVCVCARLCVCVYKHIIDSKSNFQLFPNTKHQSVFFMFLPKLEFSWKIIQIINLDNMVSVCLLKPEIRWKKQ